MNIEIIALLLSTIAVIFTMASHYANLKLHNQNKLFDEKIKAYGELILAFEKAGITLIENIQEAELIRKEKSKTLEEELELLAEEIDQAIDHMFNTFMTHIVILPKKIHDQLDRYSRFIDSDKHHNMAHKPEQLKALAEELRKKFEQTIHLMREDLQSVKLNKGLNKRLASKNIGHKILGID